MSIEGYNDPSSTDYKYGIGYFVKEVIVYAMTRDESVIIPIKTIEPSYPQARKNKRDNFKSK